MIWGYHYFRKHPCGHVFTLNVQGEAPTFFSYKWTSINPKLPKSSLAIYRGYPLLVGIIHPSIHATDGGWLQADRMLDMGFEPQIRKIMLQIPRLLRGLVNKSTVPTVLGGYGGEHRGEVSGG